MRSDNDQIRRRRITNACETCRLRKIRCDGKYPCGSCIKNNITCHYDERPVIRSKADQIYDGVIDVQKRLEKLEQQFQNSNRNFDTSLTGINARIFPAHKGTSDDLLLWPFLSKVTEGYKIVHSFDLEYARQPLKPVFEDQMPSIDQETRIILAEAFQRCVNFWYPVLSVEELETITMLRDYNDSTQSCLSLIVLGLGSVSAVVEALRKSSMETLPEIIRNLHTHCFNAAYKLLPSITLEESHYSALCFFYFAIYMSFLCRPLYASNFLNSAARKCSELLTYRNEQLSQDQSESLIRIVWSTYIIESDILAEWGRLPQSVAMSMEATLSLPDEFESSTDPTANRLSSLYLLACIAMRRLLNRVHSLLYRTKSDEERDFDINLVMELDSQLESWYTVLPEPLKFDLNDSEAHDDYQGFLRQRYFTCKAVIYRAVFTHVVRRHNEGTVISDPAIIKNAGKCLEACYYHAVNLRSYPQTVIVDSWICSLSMMSILLLFYIASCTTALQPYLFETIGYDRVDKASRNVISLIDSWQNMLPLANPSIAQSTEMMNRIHKALLNY